MMKVSSLKIKNFKNIKEFYLTDIPDVVVLAGKNGAGKSSVLEAIILSKDALRPYGNNSKIKESSKYSFYRRRFC